MKQLLLFVIILVAVNIALSFYFYKVSVRNHKLYKQDRVFHSSEDQIDLLVMGHSRPFRAIDETQFDNIVNFCSGGESNVHTYYKLKYVLEQSGKNVETVILPAGFGSFNLDDPSLISNSFYWKKYVDYLELSEVSNDFSTYTSIWLKSKVIPWYEYPYLKLSLETGDFDLKISKEKYQNGSAEEKYKMARMILDRAVANSQFYDSVSSIYLNKTIELCKNSDCKLVFVKYPVTSSYKKAMNEIVDEKELSELAIRIEEIIDKEGITLLDHQDMWLENDDHFLDPQHLNEDGKKAFSKLLKSEIARLD